MRFSGRRRLCRATFILFCLLPTVFVGGTAIVTHTPPYHALQKATWQARLSARLGFDVRITHLKRGHRGAVIRDIELCDPESGVWLARARSADVAYTDRGIVVSLGQPEIRFARLARFAQILHEHVLLRTDRPEWTCQLVASSLALRQEKRSQSLLNVRCAVDGREDGTEILLAFCATGVKDEPCVRLRMVRNRRLDPPATGWELHTGSASLPCSLGSAWLAGLERLGDECSFCGSVWVEQGTKGWNADISGVLSQIDLDALITRQFHHKLSGVADLSLDSAKIHHGRVIKTAGQLQCDGGVVSRSLLDAAQQALEMEQHERRGDNLLPFGQLSLSFSMDGQNLTITGSVESPTVVMSDAHGPLLSTGTDASLSPVNLLRVLVPRNDVLVPATKETVALFPVLPLPKVSRYETRNTRVPLRLPRR